MKEIIALVNQKGGVGKSTTADAMSAGLAKLGERVLAIDLDSQANLTKTRRGDMNRLTIREVLLGKCYLRDAIQKPEEGDSPYDIIPATPNLVGMDQLIMQVKAVGFEETLKEQLEDVKDDYDYIIIDTPPVLGVLITNALTACTNVIIPAEAEEYSVQGISQLSNTLFAVKKYRNPGLKISGVLLTKYNGRTNLGKGMTQQMEMITQMLRTHLFDARIRRCVVIGEAQAKHINIFDYDPKSNAAADYKAFIQEYLAQNVERKENG